MTRSTRRGLTVTLVAAAIVAVVAMALSALLATVLEAPPVLLGAVAVLAGAVVGALLWHANAVADDHFRGLERLRGAVLAHARDPEARLPAPRDGHGGRDGRELARIAESVAELTAAHAAERARPDRRLQAVLATITDAMIVITDQGQVSLVNYAARRMFDPERIRVGTSVFAALHRTPLVAAMKLAREEGRPVEAALRDLGGRELDSRVASLGDHGGAVIVVPADATDHRPELELDMALHDRPPPPTALGPETPLAELPVLVLDTETTGLDVRHDRIISIGAVRMHGARVYRSLAFDRLVNPGRPIPPRSMAVHGITDEMVSDASSFAEVYRTLRPFLDGMVLVGHNIAFDVAMLRRECEDAGLPWHDPPVLDTVLLCAVLDPELADLNLESLAAQFGVDVHGRHTALGDALVTAQLYARLVPRLADHGVGSFAEAQAFGMRASAIVARQKEMGW